MKQNTNLSLRVVLTLSALALPVIAQAPAQKGFESPQKAVDALIQAAQKQDSAALAEIFGPDAKDVIHSGDDVQDKAHLNAFVSMARQKTTVTADPKKKSRVILSIGATDWPFPVPLVKNKNLWYFDVAGGKDEILFRRIGSNELDAIHVCRGFVAAQVEYAALARQYTGSTQYAQRLISTPGKKDGLYWENADGTPGGPVSQAVARAIQEGYSLGPKSAYHGYYFKVLKGQGPAAPMGEMDYMVKNIMIGGFAMIATPAEYGVSGIKTFMVSHDGIVYEKDLGPDSLNAAKAIERYNPDKTWHRTDDEWPPEPEQ